MAVNEVDFSQRHLMISLGTDVWFRSEQTIEILKNQLIVKLTEQDQKDAITNSFEKMQSIARSLMDDIDYTKKENPSTFKDYVEDLKNVLKIVYGCVPLLPDAPQDPPDDIDFLKRNFYQTMERRCNHRVLQVYVPITQLVRFLRNVEEHQDNYKPADHISGKKSHGNLYILISVFILVTYAYKEILQTWLATFPR